MRRSTWAPRSALTGGARRARQGSRDEFTSPSTLLEWAVPRSKSAVTESRILPGLSHFQLEGPEWDTSVAQWSMAFGARVGAWGDAAPPQAAAAAALEAQADAAAAAAAGQTR